MLRDVEWYCTARIDPISRTVADDCDGDVDLEKQVVNIRCGVSEPEELIDVRLSVSEGVRLSVDENKGIDRRVEKIKRQVAKRKWKSFLNLLKSPLLG